MAGQNGVHKTVRKIVWPN